MAAFRIIRRFRDLLDVTFGTPSDGDVPTYSASTQKLVMQAPTGGGGGGGAPTDATYITQTANGSLSAEQALSGLATGVVKVTTATGVLSTASEGTDYYKPGATDVAVADGGTGASTAATARSNLGVVIGTDVEAHDTDLTTIAGLTATNDDVIQRKAGAWANRTIAQLLSDLAGAGTTFQPLDSDLTAIAALTTTVYGRSVLALADAAALRTAAGLDTAATHPATDFDTAGAAAAAQAASQPLDSDLTAIAALTTTTYGRALLTLANAAAADFNVKASNLSDVANASTARTNLGVAIGTNVQAWDADLDAIAALTSAANKMPYSTAAQTWALADLTAFARTFLDDADAATVRATIAAMLSTNSLSDIAAANATGANWSNNSKKITSLANGTATADAAALGQLPPGLPLFEPASGGFVGLPLYCGNSGTTITMTDQLMWLLPLPVGGLTRTITAISVRTNGGASAGATLRFGVYADSNGAPSGAALVDSGAVAATGAFSNITGTVSLAVTPFTVVWIAVAQQGAPSPTNTIINAISAGSLLATIVSSSISNACSIKNSAAYKMSAIGSGALPTISGTSLSDTNTVTPNLCVTF